MAAIQDFSRIDLNNLATYRASRFNSRVKTGCFTYPVKGLRANNLILAMARMVHADENNVENSLGSSVAIQKIFIKNEDVMNKAKRNVLLGFMTRICRENPLFSIEVVSHGISDDIINQKLRLCKSITDIYEQANRIICDIYHMSDPINKDLEKSKRSIGTTYEAVMNYEYDKDTILKDFSDKMKDFSCKCNDYKDIILDVEDFVCYNSKNDTRHVEENNNIRQNVDKYIEKLKNIKDICEKLYKTKMDVAQNIIKRESRYLITVREFIYNPYTPKYLKKEFSEKYKYINDKIKNIDDVLNRILISNIEIYAKDVKHLTNELATIKDECDERIKKYKIR